MFSIVTEESKQIIMLAKQRRGLIEPRGRLGETHGRAEQPDCAGCGMLAFPDKAALLNMRVVEGLADLVDRAAGNAGGAQLGQPFIGWTLEKGLLENRD